MITRRVFLANEYGPRGSALRWVMPRSPYICTYETRCGLSQTILMENLEGAEGKDGTVWT
jgi:hypothetical protein